MASDSLGWPTKDIVYTAIVGAVMIAAYIEWAMWLASFVFCLFKAFQKAEFFSSQILAVIIGITFFTIRLVFLPLMTVTLPLPTMIYKHFSSLLVSILQWIGFWSFSCLLIIPWGLCSYWLATHVLGRTKRIKEVLTEYTAPKVVVVMPVYKEDAEVLLVAIDSVVDSDYPTNCIHVFLSFDGLEEDDTYMSILVKLGVPQLESYPLCIDIIYRTARITISRFKHGGKRKCQKSTFKLIDEIYEDYIHRKDNLFILFIDSDCILDNTCIQNFMYDMELSPGNNKEMVAMTGIITSTTKKHSLITVLQDIEYIHGQIFERTVEASCGSVTCLPGALTMLRFSAFRRMAKFYFADHLEGVVDMFDYGKCHLGEDRWLTHLFMVGAKKRYQIGICTSAFCKTEAVQTVKSLVKQRRRWFLGFITNEACMLTDVRIWRKYPMVNLLRFMQNTIRTTSLLFFVMILSLVTTEKSLKRLPVGFIAVSLGLNWLMMIFFGWKLHRYKIWMYPLMFVLSPFFNWFYMMYAVMTAGKRTWGGPRADAAAADAATTPQEAIELAEEKGDDLNIKPESFALVKYQNGHLTGGGPALLLPPSRVEGRFVAAEQLPNGFYEQINDSTASNIAFTSLNPDCSGQYMIPGPSTTSESRTSSRSSSPVVLPRRIESFLDEEDRIKYAMAQASQRAAGGEAYMMESPDLGGGPILSLSVSPQSNIYSNIEPSMESNMEETFGVSSENVKRNGGTHIFGSDALDGMVFEPDYNARSPALVTDNIETVVGETSMDITLKDHNTNELSPRFSWSSDINAARACNPLANVSVSTSTSELPTEVDEEHELHDMQSRQ